jgi:hypothetical protein
MPGAQVEQVWVEQGEQLLLVLALPHSLVATVEPMLTSRMVAVAVALVVQRRLGELAAMRLRGLEEMVELAERLRVEMGAKVLSRQLMLSRAVLLEEEEEEDSALRRADSMGPQVRMVW